MACFSCLRRSNRYTSWLCSHQARKFLPITVHSLLRPLFLPAAEKGLNTLIWSSNQRSASPRPTRPDMWWLKSTAETRTEITCRVDEMIVKTTGPKCLDFKQREKVLGGSRGVLQVEVQLNMRVESSGKEKALIYSNLKETGQSHSEPT